LWDLVGVNSRLLPLGQALSLTQSNPQIIPAGFTLCPQAFIAAWTPAELEERRLLYKKAWSKAQRMAAFLPDERIAFEQ
jgi:hypothetical protein